MRFINISNLSHNSLHSNNGTMATQINENKIYINLLLTNDYLYFHSLALFGLSLVRFPMAPQLKIKCPCFLQINHLNRGTHSLDIIETWLKKN